MAQFKAKEPASTSQYPVKKMINIKSEPPYISIDCYQLLWHTSYNDLLKKSKPTYELHWELSLCVWHSLSQMQ